MKTKFAIFLLSITTLLFSQDKNYNTTSIELGYGYVSPIDGFRKELGSNFSGFRHYDIGFRYMFSEKYGFKLRYSNDLYIHSSDDRYGTKFNNFSILGYGNIPKVLNYDNYFRSFTMLGYAGGTISNSNSIYYGSANEYIYTLTIGLVPQYKISDSFSLLLDLGLNYNMSQDFYFDGDFKNQNGEKFTSKNYTISLGFKYSIGDNKIHADFY